MNIVILNGIHNDKYSKVEQDLNLLSDSIIDHDITVYTLREMRWISIIVLDVGIVGLRHQDNVFLMMTKLTS